MPPSAELVSRLLSSIYEAAASPALWPVFLEQLKTAVSADCAFCVLDSKGCCDLALSTGFTPQAVEAYGNYYAQRDVFLQGFLEKAALHGRWIGNHRSVVSDQDLHSSELFNDFMRPIGVAHQCGVLLPGLNGGVFGGVALLRSEAPGDFGEDAISLLAVLAPHLDRAFQLHRSTTRLRSENEELRCSIEACGVAMITLAADGQVIRMTESARKLLGTRNGLAIVNHRLVASDPREKDRLQQLLCGAAATGAGKGTVQPVLVDGFISPQAASRLYSAPSGGAMLISRPAPLQPLQLIVSPFRSSEILLADRPCAIVFLNDPDAAPVSRLVLLRSLYGLNPAEGRVADLLVSGADVPEIAERLRVSQDTVRFYLKSIFRKTGTRRQSELVRIAMRLPDTPEFTPR